jgi:hypothetical protein
MPTMVGPLPGDALCPALAERRDKLQRIAAKPCGPDQRLPGLPSPEPSIVSDPQRTDRLVLTWRGRNHPDAGLFRHLVVGWACMTDEGRNRAFLPAVACTHC